MERYEAYKDSGVEWIGEIPKHWTCANLGSISSQRKNLNRDGSVDNVLSLSYGTIKRRLLDNTGLLPESFNTYNVIEEGDVVLRLTDLQNDQKSLRVGLCHEKGVITAAYTTLEPQSIDSRYLFYNLATFDYWKGFYGLAGGVRQSLTFDGIRGLRFPLPSVLEQQAIADFLDSKTAEIDSLVADCVREVELLQEYRKAVISETVTKGLDPDAPMKDSGVEWIGEIPTRWEIQQLGRLCTRIFDGPFGSNLKSNDYVDGGVRVVRLENLKYLHFDETKESYVTPEKYETINQHTVYPDDLIVATFIIDSVKACRLPSNIGFAVNKADCLGVRTGEGLDVDYLKYYLSSCQVFDYLSGLTHGSTRQRINTTQLKALLVLLPPKNVQHAIVTHLDTKIAEIDSLIENKQSMVDRLREYRKSLISEAVTGKFKVPGID